MMSRVSTLAAVVPLCAGLAACALPPPRLDAERQWGEAISNLGLFPIYPPSEDVMVGDVFLHTPGSQYFDLVRVTAAPRGLLARQLCFQEQDRLVADTIKDGTSGAVNVGLNCNTARGQHRVASHSGTTDRQHVTRLREAAVPTLEVGRFSEGEIAGAGLLGNFGAALGLGWSSGTSLRVELGDLQTLTLDELRGSRLVEDVVIDRLRADPTARNGRDRPDQNALTPLMLARSLVLSDTRTGGRVSRQFCDGAFPALEASGARIVVANRLLFASRVTFDYLTESVATTRLALDFASALAGMPQQPGVPPVPRPPAAPATAPTDGAPPAPRSPAAFANDFDGQRAALLNQAARIITIEPTTPGQAAARLTTGRFGTLALERSFARPAAVGMGAALHYSLADAAIPANEDEIGDVLNFCRAVHGEAGADLAERLTANLAWARYLDARDRNLPADRASALLSRPAAAAPTTARPGRSFTPLQPNASSRVRL